MKSAQFIKLLSVVRRADDALGETLTEIALEVFEQFHVHGNKTPQIQLLLAIDGGIDEHGFFGDKGAEVRGVSAAVARLFTGLRKLGKRDENADVDALAADAVDKGIRTRADAAADAKAKREHAAKVKAKAEKEAEKEAEAERAEEIKCSLIMASGAAIKLTPVEAVKLAQFLETLRDQDAVDNLASVIDMPAAAEPMTMHLIAAA